MIPSYLNSPDHVDDQRSISYSSHVAQALYHAYSHVKQRQLGNFEANLRPLLVRPMTQIQRMRLLFVLSLTAHRYKEYAVALDYASGGLDIAHRQGDAGSSAILARLAGSASHELQHFRSAHIYYLHVMSALSELKSLPRDNPERYDILGRLAIETFLLAQYDAAMQYLQYAREIAPQNDRLQQTARLDWMDALVHRWHQQPLSALQSIQSAAPSFSSSADRSERGRFHIVYADIALDCSESMQDMSGANAAFLRLADRHVSEGLSDILAAHDDSGEGLALLAQARYVRLACRNEDDRPILDKVEMIARQLRDVPLLSQAYTVRGDAFSARGEISSALTCYREAIDTTTGTDARSFILKPQRSLWKLQEMNG